MVIGAKLSLYLGNNDPNNGEIDVHKVNSSWNSGTVTWNTQPQFNTEVEDYQIMSSYGFYTWDITGLVKEWYTAGNNNGLLLKHKNESAGYSNIVDYISSDTSIEFEAGRPRATIFYINNSGIEGYWNYHSQSVGRAGVSYTNDFNGNVVHIHDDITMTGSRNPISIKHVYNSNNLGWDPSKPWFGRGWNLSIYQWLVRKQIGAAWYYEYTDGDGTKHYFKDTGGNELKDELNIGYTLIKDSGGYFKYIKDKDDNQIKFYGDAVGSLYSFIDNKGNETKTTWEKAANGVWCITALKDATGRKVTLHYDKNAYLTDIVDPSGLKTEFVYESTYNKLIKINYPDGKFSKYDYYSNYYLYGVTNVDDYSIWFDYTSYAPYRVKRMYEWYKGVYGNQISMTYGNNTTKFTDLKNRSEFYQFDNAGKTVSIKNADDSAQYFRYGDANNKTKIGQSSKMQKTIMNLLENHDAELNTGWVPHNNLATYTLDEKVLGNKSFKISSPTYQNGTYFEQYVKLTKGKTYTFSGEIKAVGVTQGENIGAALTIAYLDASGAWKYERVYVNGTKDWARYENSFTLPNDSTNDRVWIAVELLKASGTAYFDCLQLEEGEVANRYNLVENPDFTLWDSKSWKPLYWTSNGNCDVYDYVYKAPAGQPAILDESAMKLEGYSGIDKGIYQDITVSGKKGDVFVLGGWAKAKSAYLSSGRLFQLDLGFINDAGKIAWKTVPFNSDTDEWQYAASAVVADADYSKLRVYISYYENVNKAFFDGIQLYKEEFGTSYQYDSKGNVVSTANLAKQNSQFQYNDKNDLISSIDPKGNKFEYEYDNKHNVTKATTSENVVYSFSYDNYGNPLRAKVSDASGSLKSESIATYKPSGNYIMSILDSSGNIVFYSFDENKGTLNRVTDSKGQSTLYTYERYTNAISTVSKNVDNVNVTNTYEYDKDKLVNIGHNNFKYNFVYDGFGNNTDVNIKSADGTGVQNLITNKYEDKTHMLQYSQYGNGNKIAFGYDSLDRLVSKKNNTEERFRYKYDGNSNLAIKEDLVNRKNYRYFYDLSDRLMKIEEVDSVTAKKIGESRYDYDLNNNLASMKETIKDKEYITTYSYDKDNKPLKVTTNNKGSIDYKYDGIGRRTEQTITSEGKTFTTKYAFKPGIKQCTTEKIQSITNGTSAINYTYDYNGNIETITSNGKQIKYYYNELNELKREDNEVLNKTITYTYDIGGNILSKVEYPYTTANPITLAATSTINYSYTDQMWKDKLTAYNGKAITYDAIGNPLTYDGTTYTWEMGRQLKSINKGSLAISYKYDDGGIRTEKTVNGVTTSYHLLGDKVTYEETGSDKIYYTYDAAGNLVTMTLNGVEYYYLRNGQNDIIGLVDKTGTQVVSYTYDSWGKLISIDGSLKASVGVKNPYRYRGYRYDTETGLYYLNSRYYNPEWGRFINADMIVANTGDILGSNMYAYCKNNPVNMEDQDGDIPTMVVGALIGIGVQLAADAIAGEFSGWGSLASAAFTGALSNGTGAMAVAVRIIGGATIKNVVDTVIDGGNKKENWNWKQFGQDIVLNALGEAVAGVSESIV